MDSPTQNTRSGILAGGNWIIDQVKIIDVYPKHEQLANIYGQSQGTGGSPYNVLLDLAKMGAPSRSKARVWSARTHWVNIFWTTARIMASTRNSFPFLPERVLLIPTS